MVNFQRVDISTVIQPHCYLILYAMHVNESISGLENISGDLLDRHEISVIDTV